MGGAIEDDPCRTFRAGVTDRPGGARNGQVHPNGEDGPEEGDASRSDQQTSKPHPPHGPYREAHLVSYRTLSVWKRPYVNSPSGKW